jgi:hypothetical protein
MQKLNGIIALFGLALTTTVQARVRGPLTPAGCLHLSRTEVVQVKGRLLVQTFPGRPNFESVAKGDEAERTYVVKLPKPICLDDDDQFADPAKRFDTVHVSTTMTDLWPKLRAALGRSVVVSGEGLASFNGHHHAPLVVFAKHVETAP